MGGGEADSYGALLTLRTDALDRRALPGRTERDHTGLGGSSLGGLVSLYLGLKNSESFGRLAVLSPSVWWNHKSILGILNETVPLLNHKPRIWLDAGDHEGRMTLRDAELLAKRLRANGWTDEENLHFERIHGGTHDEASWSTRVRPLLKFLFPRNGL
jgi:predicted alpha/beta superfamily hydrolase